MTMRYLFLLAVAIGSSAFPLHAQRPLNCRTAGPESAGIIQSVKEMLASPDPEAVAWRTGFGLAGADSASVSVVTRKRICTMVTRAIDNAFRIRPSTQAYLVMKVDTMYVAFEPLGQRQSMSIVDRKFNLRYFIP
jgi:hypothetical protein